MKKDFFTMKDVVDKVLLSKKRNFVESVDVAIRLSCDDTISGEVNFPHPFVNVRKFLVFAEGEDAVAVRNLGIDMVGGVDLISSIKSNKSMIKKMNYCVASSSLTSEVQKIAKILAMKGIMPNVNNGTLTKDLLLVIESIRNGKAWFKSSKAKIINVKIGDVSFDAGRLYENIFSLLSAVLKSNVKVKKAISSVAVSTTMGPAFFCDVASICEEVI